ncbi:hypothetical protein NW768_002206 [Fusarium equiseti]|uniref:Uncharacterized protein n=1 Tax=Fusarium equiseti TaxID=61235 RepID=A0ABQ8RN65_FUSEQ|nr:hypothetical protein NW768_002206 [Fusarium equiseti]
MTGRSKCSATNPPPQEERSRKRSRMTNVDESGEVSLEAQMHERYPVQDCRPTRRIIADFGEPTPEGWTGSDEETVTQWWDESATKKEIGRLKKAKQQALLRLWKASFRLFKTSPLWITCLPDGIQYQPSLTHDRTYIALYSHKFCEELLKLIVHPFWDGNIYKLRCALKFAVACRVDDKEMMSYVHVPERCRALRFLNHSLEEDNEFSIHTMHERARYHVRKEGHSPSSWSDFLFHVGETVEGNSLRRPPVKKEFLAEHDILTLPLTGWDVEALIQAVDTMPRKYPELRWCSTEDALQAWNNSTKGREMPQFEQLSELYEAFTKEVYRKTIDLMKNAAEDEDVHDNGDAESFENEDVPESSDNEDGQDGRPEPSGHKELALPVPDLGGLQGSTEADVQFDSHFNLHQEGLQNSDTSIVSQPGVSLRQNAPSTDELPLPRSPPYMPPRVPTPHELATRGSGRSTARLERENKELRDALKKTEEAFHKSEERFQNLQQLYEQKITRLERTVEDQTKMIELLDERRKNPRNIVDQNATQSDVILQYLGRQVIRRRDEIEETQASQSRLEARLEGRISQVEKELETLRIESSRLHGTAADFRELD